GGEDGAPDVLEVDVDAVGTCHPKRLHQIVGLVVHARVEAELVNDEAAFLARAGDAHRAAPPRLRELTDDRSDSTRCRRYDYRLARLRLADVEKTDERREAGHAEDAECRRNRRDRGIELAHIFSGRRREQLPAVVARDDVARGEVGMARLDDL